MPKLSVIVPIYNTELYLGECLESIIGQKFTDIEIICVDDGSTDGSAHVCDIYAKKDSRIKVVRKQRLGVALARCTGLQLAQGDYISFVDSDDWIEGDLYSDAISRMDEDKAIDIYINLAMRVEQSGTIRPHMRLAMAQKFSAHQMAEELVKRDFLNWSVWDKIYRKKVLDGYILHENIDYAEDLHMNWHAIHRAKMIWYCPYRKYYYRAREHSATKIENIVISKRMDVFLELLSDNEFTTSNIRCHLFEYIKKPIQSIFSQWVLTGWKEREKARILYNKLHAAWQYCLDDVSADSVPERFFLNEFEDCISQYDMLLRDTVSIIKKSFESNEYLYIYGIGKYSEYLL